MKKSFILLGRLASGFLVLMLFAWLGRLVSGWLGGTFPGSILGMLLLTLALSCGLVKISWVESGAGLLLRWLSLLFVPISVALIEQLDVLARHGLSMLITACVSTVLVLAVAGRLWQWLEQKA